jgi:hypothetical protein
MSKTLPEKAIGKVYLMTIYGGNYNVRKRC